MIMALQDGPKDGTRRQSARNPRRRQRHDSDSLQHQPRRKRSKITTDTYETPSAADGVSNASTAMNGHVEPRGRKSSTPIDSLDMPVRAKKQTQKRVVKGDGSSVLTQNAHYSVKHLPSTPDIIRNSASDFRGSILASPPYALALTSEHAYVWDYTSSVPVAHPRSFDIPQADKHAESLPLGSLVTNGASTSVGLLVITSTTGKVTFWENIDTAESLSLFRQRPAGVEGSIGSLFSGEVVCDVTSADHAGFIVTLSSGRVAQISLRDAQGKPKISAQFLRSNDALGGGGLFGSLKGVLGVGWKRDIVAVRTRSQGSRGQMQVISVTASAQMQIWDLAWSGQNVYKGSVDFKEMLQSEFSRLASQGGTASVRLLDFAIAPSRAKCDEVSILGDDQPVDLVMLARTEGSKSPSYALVEFTLAGSKGYIERTILLNSNLVSGSDDKARLLLPAPGHTAMVVFDQKIVVVSLVSPDAGPDAQLLMEAHRATFQDAVFLRQDKNLTITGYSGEDSTDKSGQSAAVMFIKGFGLVRLTANEPDNSVKPRMPVKSRIEQAIFYGTLSDNILDFSKHNAREYASDDVEEAAIAISDEILGSESPFLSTALPSIETQIGMRVKASRALIAHLKKQYAPLSHLNSWKLLTNAEKLEVGLELWRNYDDGVQNASPRPSVLPAVVKVVRKQTRGIKISKESEVDEVRHWFTYDLRHLDKLCFQTLYLVNNGYANGTLQHMMKLLSECDDIIFNVFETAFAFRANNAEIYNIDPTVIEDGILEDGWEDLPEPWTATHEGINLLDKFIDIARNYTVDLYEKPEDQREIDELFVNKVVRENVRLVQILCRCYRERIGWSSASSVERLRQSAPSLVEKFRKSRGHHLRGLVKIGQAGAGTAVAEKYNDMESLVKLVISESAYLVEMMNEAGVTQDEENVIQSRMDGLQSKVDGYFRTFGDDWATAFFDSHLTSHRSYGLLSEAGLYQAPLTRFLRAEKARGRLGWINEVLHEENLLEAQKALTDLAQDHENRLWNKKVEVSLSKLAAMAVQEENGKRAVDGVATNVLRVQDNDLAIIGVQEEVYSHLEPILYGAMDHDAEVQIVSDAYAVSIRRSLPALHQLLEIAFDDLLNHKVLPAEQLVDMLTLMNSVPSNDPEVDISGREFHLAMHVLKGAKSTMEEQHFETALRLVWKRSFLEDEWDLINDTARKSDRLIQRQIRETSLCQTMVLGLQDVLSDAKSGIRSIPPAEAIGAGSSPEDLQHRFASEDLRDPIIHDNSTQDTQLQKFIKQDNMQHWYEACLEEAKKMLEEGAEERAAEQKAIDAMQKSIAEHAGLKAHKNHREQMNGNGKLANGQIREDEGTDVESQGDGDDEGRDDDGDVEMS